MSNVANYFIYIEYPSVLFDFIFCLYMYQREQKEEDEKNNTYTQRAKENLVLFQKHTIFSTEWNLFYIKLLQRLSNALDEFLSRFMYVFFFHSLQMWMINAKAKAK